MRGRERHGTHPGTSSSMGISVPNSRSGAAACVHRAHTATAPPRVHSKTLWRCSWRHWGAARGYAPCEGTPGNGGQWPPHRPRHRPSRRTPPFHPRPGYPAHIVHRKQHTTHNTAHVSDGRAAAQVQPARTPTRTTGPIHVGNDHTSAVARCHAQPTAPAHQRATVQRAGRERAVGAPTHRASAKRGEHSGWRRCER